MTKRDRKKEAADRIRPWANLIGGLLHLTAAIISWLTGS